MEELNSYVDRLFKGYKLTNEMLDLKAEILGKLAAKKAELMEIGYSQDEALKMAEESITEIDSLIDGNRCIYISKFKRAVLQKILLYLGLSFIIAAICRTTPDIAAPQTVVFWVLLVSCLVYLGICVRKSPDYWMKTGYINTKQFEKWKKYGWLLAIILIIICWLRITYIHFAARLLFHHPLPIGGSDQIAALIFDYILPLLFLVIPLVLAWLPAAVYRYLTDEGSDSGRSDDEKRTSRINILLCLLILVGLLVFAAAQIHLT